MLSIRPLPERWTEEWNKPRRVRIRFRKGEGFEVKAEFAAADGTVVNVHRPRVMEEAADGGHSLYAGDVCWDVVEFADDLPMYLSEHDFFWIDERP